MSGGILLLVLLFLLPGTAAWLAFGASLKSHLRAVEIAYLIILTGVALVNWTALTLAEFEIFSLLLLAALVLGSSLLLGGWAVWRRRHQRPFANLTWSWSTLGSMLLLGLLVLLSGRPSEYIVGGRDHGVYVNTGIHIVHSGGILVRDEAITAVPEAARPLLVRPETRLNQPGFPGPWSEGQHLTGLTIRDLDNGVYLLHGFHLYPALIAVFYAAGGVSLALMTTMALALLGSLGIYLVAARLFGQTIGLLTQLLLTLSVTQVWFTGYPTAEMLLQVLFWGGLLAAIIMMQTGNRWTAVMAGASFGLMHLAKLDTVLVPPILALFLLTLWLRDQFRPAYWWAIGVYLLLGLQALFHAYFIATIYFVDHAVRNLLPQFLADRVTTATAGHPYPLNGMRRFLLADWELLAAGVLLVGAVIWVLRRIRPAAAQWLAGWAGRTRRWQAGLALGLGGIILVTAVTETITDLPFLNQTVGSVHLSRLYLTRVGLVAGAIGLLGLIYASRTLPQRFTLFMLWGNVLPLYVLGAGTALDHFWVVRRFITLTFPGFILGMAWLIWELRPRQHRQWPLAVLPLGLLAAIVLGFWQHTGPIVGMVEYDGLTAQLTTLADTVPEEAVLLLETSNPAQRLDMPLWLLFGRSVYTIRSEIKNDPVLATAVSAWEENGRSVYWLAADGVAPPQWPGWTAVYETTHTISAPLMETPRHAIPKRIERFQAQLDVYRFVPAAAGDQLDAPVLNYTRRF